jgi:hypothetical protein
MRHSRCPAHYKSAPVVLKAEVGCVTVHGYLGPFANLEAAAWMLRLEERGDGSSVSRLMFCCFPLRKSLFQEYEDVAAVGYVRT